MGMKLQARAWTRGGLAGLLVAGLLAALPVSAATAGGRGAVICNSVREWEPCVEGGGGGGGNPPYPTVTTTGDQTVTATSASGAPAVYSAYGSDSVYGTYPATCTPAAGTVLPVGSNTITCTTFSPGNISDSKNLTVTVVKANPMISWAPPASVSYGATYGALATASMASTGATGAITYTKAGGATVTATDVVPVGANQSLTATYVPSGAAATWYNTASLTKAVSVVPASQTVSFRTGTPSSKTYGDPAFSVLADGTSGGGGVTITAGSGSTCTVNQTTTGTSVSATITLTGAGSCVLLANQAATSQYVAAPTAQKSVTVAVGTPIITWAQPSNLTFGDTLAGALTASANATGSIRYSVNGSPVNLSTVLDAGAAQTIVATFTPTRSADYTTAVASRVVTVAKAPQTLTLAAVTDKTYGAAPFDLVIAGTGPGVVTTTAVGGCTVAGTRVTVILVGDCTVTAVRSGDSNHLASAIVSRTFHVAPAVSTVHWDTPAPIRYGTPLGDGQLDAVGDPGGSIAYTLADGTPANGVVLDAGDHLLTAIWTAIAPGTAPSTATTTVHVDRARPTLTWTPPGDAVVGTALGDDQLSAASDRPGTTTYTVDAGSAPARGQVLAVGAHVLHATFVPDDARNLESATAQVPFTVRAAAQPPLVPTDSGAEHQVDEQRVETQADLEAGQTRTFAVTCPNGYVASDGSGRVDAVDQGTGTLADVHVLESRATDLATWTVTLANGATGRAQGKVFADCVQGQTSAADGHSHALVIEPAATRTTPLTGPTSVTLDCGAGRSPVAPGYLLDGAAVVRRSEPSGASSWTFDVVPTGADPATTGSFSLHCLADRVTSAAGHDHLLTLAPVTQQVTVPAGQSLEAQTTCGDLARGVVGGWSLDDGLVLVGSEPRAKTRATRLLNPTSGPLTAELTLQCLETRTASDAPASVGSASIAVPTSRAVTVGPRARSAVRVACSSGTTSCTGTVSLVALRTQRVAGHTLRKGTVLAASTYSVAAGASARVRLQPSRSGKRALVARGLLHAQLRVGTDVRTVQLRR